MATCWVTGIVVPFLNGQGLGVRAAPVGTGTNNNGQQLLGARAAAKKQQPKGGKKQQQAEKSEKGFFDRVLEWMDKESFSETDPILSKPKDDKKGVSVAPPPQKKGGFFGLG